MYWNFTIIARESSRLEFCAHAVSLGFARYEENVRYASTSLLKINLLIKALPLASNNIRYAYDTVILADKTKDLQILLDQINEEI